MAKEKMISFYTKPETWQAIKVEAYKHGKTVKQFINELLERTLVKSSEDK